MLYYFQIPTKENIESLSALEIAEQMTYLDHQIFISITSEYVIKVTIIIEYFYNYLHYTLHLPR
jgi:hypothetical protein